MTKNYADLLPSFEACELDAGTFTHADHVGVAYQMLKRYDFLTASFKYANCINAIATRAGAPRKFNTTVTMAFLSVIAERMETTGHETYEEFIGKNPDLHDSKVLEKWYSADRLQSDLARTTFLLPDEACV